MLQLLLQPLYDRVVAQYNRSDGVILPDKVRDVYEISEAERLENEGDVSQGSSSGLQAKTKKHKVKNATHCFQ